MSLTNQLSSSMISSSSSTFLAPSNLHTKPQNASLPMAKRVNSVKCVASPSEMIEYKTSVSRNSNMYKLHLFPEIARRRYAHLLKYRDAQIIILGIGDTTEPIPQVITSAIAKVTVVMVLNKEQRFVGLEMRIRKNTKLSSVLLATAGYGGERPETYVCHLNQSPWDVIPVTSSGDGELTNLLDSSWFLPLSSSSSSPPLIHQFNGEDSFNGNVSLGDCNGAYRRFNSSMGNNHSLVSLEKLNFNAAEDKYELSPDVEEPMDQSDCSDIKSEALEPISPVKTSGDDEQVAVTMPAPPKRGRPRGTGKKAAASTAALKNPYEFYYYSGFGPRWGRKRGGSGDEMIGLGDNKKSRSTSTTTDEEDAKTAPFGGGSVSFDGFDYVEEDYDVMDQDQESDRGMKKKKEKMIVMKKTIKRGRKPVKERSLKSLM